MGLRLPRDETAFFGRTEEIADVVRRFDSGARLVTIVGLGGIGKTRLALVVASQDKRRVVFAALGDARSLEPAVRMIAQALRFPLKPESHARVALESLAEALTKEGDTLLVLDNTEQLGPVAAELASGLLDGAEGLRILATSREPIGTRGEEKLVLGTLAEEEAVSLLRDRARAAAGALAPISDADAIALVRRVDCLPLAIELAASRLEVLSPSDLVLRLAERLDVLSDASGAAPPMHRTMRNTLDWSWDLLSSTQRSALVQASVFAAPFGIDAAEEIVAIDEGEVLDALESLVKRSLVFRVPIDGKIRLGMFRTVRAWAREKLNDSEVVTRHARHYLDEAERAAALSYGERANQALDTLADMLPELLAAFEATKDGSPSVAARIVLALSDLLLFRGLFELRSELFSLGVDAAERAADDRLLARALVANARVTLEVGRMPDAEAELRRALDLAEKGGDDATRAEASRSLGWALIALGRGAEAEAALADALRWHVEQGSPRGIADCFVARGILRALGGAQAEGLALLREALAIHVENGDVIRQQKVFGFSQLVGHDAREIATGLPRDVLARAPSSSFERLPTEIAEMVDGERALGQRWQHAIALYRRGALADERGEPGAIELFDEAIATLGRIGVSRGIAAIQAHAAVALAGAGDHADAAARLERARSASATDPLAELTVSVFAAAVDVLGGGDPSAARDILARVAPTESTTPELAAAIRLLERSLSSKRTIGAPALVVGPESRWIVAPHGERLDLVRHGPVRRLLDRLVVAHIDERGVALSAEALIEAGWPGERMRHTAGLLRVYSAVRRLRRLGLESILMTRDDGYLLDPDAIVRREGA